MLTPKDMENMGPHGKEYDVDSIIKDIDDDIIKNHMQYKWEEAQIIMEDGYELPWGIRNRIAKAYISVGWGYVFHKTSSENNERSGLNHFMLFRKDQLPYDIYPNLKTSGFTEINANNPDEPIVLN